MDINELVENEVPDSDSIKDLIEERLKINKFKSELEERRKEIDSQISEFCSVNDLEQITGDNFTVSIISKRGSGRWNKKELEAMLTPFQLEKVYSVGKPSKYLRVAEKSE